MSFSHFVVARMDNVEVNEARDIFVRGKVAEQSDLSQCTPGENDLVKYTADNKNQPRRVS